MEARFKLFGHPIHQMLIVLPLGLLTGVVLFDVLHLILGSEQLRVVAYWLIPAGVVTGLVTNGRDAADRIRQEGWDFDIRSRAAAQRAAGMAVTSDRLEPVVVATRRGEDQLMRILETLARVELTVGLDVAQLVSETGSRLPRDATVIAIVTAVSEETAVALGNLRRRRHGELQRRGAGLYPEISERERDGGGGMDGRRQRHYGCADSHSQDSTGHGHSPSDTRTRRCRK